MNDNDSNPFGSIHPDAKDRSKEVLPDVPAGMALALVPTGAGSAALARRIGGEAPKDEMEFACLTCGWGKNLKFDPEEIAALDGDISNYTGPCPGIHKSGPLEGQRCNCMTLAPRTTLWGKDFPSMSDLAAKNKRHEARVQAEEFVEVVGEKMGSMVSGALGVQPPTIVDPGSDPDAPANDDLPDEPDLSTLKPR